MKVSLNWVKQFVDLDTPTDELVATIGQQLGAVEEVIDIGARYRGACIVTVVKCEKHPNADKLSVCLVDDGGAVKDVARNDDGLVEVVCGAPNVAAGMRAVWLPPGVTVPASYDKEPFVLEARELRGVTSNGMLASASELSIGDDHNGIVEVDVPAEPGADFAEAYELDDVVLDIENKMFTHRPDCFGILGVAREIAGITDQQFNSPSWYSTPFSPETEKATTTELAIDNQLPELVPRFLAVTLEGLSVKSSPLMIRSYLARVGVRPINNIVDVTNYIMLLTGQPLHAYDADKLRKLAPQESSSLQLGARMSRKGDSLELLDGRTLTFDDEETILITSYDTPVGVGGVMGGSATEVDEQTKRVVLECANFDMYTIRRASMRHGLFTDAVTRFNKGQSPRQNDRVLGEAVSMLAYVSGAQVASAVQDEAHEIAQVEPVWITPSFIEDRLGLHVGADEVKRRLENVEFRVHKSADGLRVEVPFWRTDIAIPEDIVEEVGRLKGFDALPLDLPQASIAPVERNRLLDFKYQIRDVLAAAGANEVLTYSFVHGKLLESAGQNHEDSYKLNNALSPDLHYYRQSLTPSLLDKVHANIKAGYGVFTLFELGRVQQKGVMDEQEPELPAEHERLSIVFASDEKTWAEHFSGSAFYQVRAYLDQLCRELGVEYSIQPIPEEVEDMTSKATWAPFDKARSGVVVIDDRLIGIIGEPHRQSVRTLKLPIAAAALELDVQALQEAARGKRYQQLSRYPTIFQDISLKLPADTLYRDIAACVDLAVTEAATQHIRCRVSPIDIYQSKDDASSKHVTFRISAVSDQKTMTDPELSRILDAVADQTDSQLSAERL